MRQFILRVSCVADIVRLALGVSLAVAVGDAVAMAPAIGDLSVRRAGTVETVPDAALRCELVSTPEADGAQAHVLRLSKRARGDLALEIEYAAEIPEAEGALVWHHDMRTIRKVAPADGRVRNASRQKTVGTEWLSYWPFAVATGEDGKGRALALDPDYPAFYRIDLDAGARRLVLHLDIAVTDEAPEAEVRFAEYPVAGKSPFRRALTGYCARYPKAFASRVKEHGVWMPFSKISAVKGWEDFGFKFKEGNNEPDWDKAHGIHTFHYTEPTTWWQHMEGPTNGYDLAIAAGVAKIKDPDPRAKAWESSVFHDRDGRPVGFIKDAPWCRGVVWNYNDAPGIAGETTGWKVKMSHPPRSEYIDSAEMYVTVPLDFNRAHFAGMRTPLCWEAKTGRPAVFKGLIGFEYVRAAAEKAHAGGCLTMANGTPMEWFWLAPNLDVLGTEWDWQDWREGKRVWTPPSDSKLIYRRALCGKKPYCFLMNTDFSLLTPERTRKYFDRCLAYGAFPGFFSVDAATAPYFTRPELYERDRPLYRKYLPVVRALSEAGWTPDNRLLEVSDARAVSEQFGERYVTLFNPLERELEVKVRFAGANVREMLTGERVPDPQVRTTIVLAPESARAYEVTSVAGELSRR